MAQVQLFKKVGKYINKKDGKEKTSTRFYVKCGDSLVPIKVPYFEGKDGERDYQYSNRKAVLTAFAENLPDKDKSEEKSDKDESEEKEGKGKVHLQPFDPVDY